MQITDFKEIVSTFTDPGEDILIDKHQVAISVNGDVITAKLSMDSGDIYVDEGSGRMPGSKWIINRLARLPLLASRLQDNISLTDSFVSPSAKLLSTLEQATEDNCLSTDDTLVATTEIIDNRSPLETMVLYITSDAGEGKTSLINQLAHEQAKRYREGKADWLFVPIPLGGRHFLRFDDITVGALLNRYRFQSLYYNSFVALVKMGVIVPAFDGFEEMFVESSSGEALSAMGSLVSSLDSRGTIVVAARKAYFEFENMRSQEKLFDSIRTLSVGFGKVELERWSKKQFIAYCNKRNVANPEEIYRRISERLSTDHALLTRAVLVGRLIDVVLECDSMDDFLGQLEVSGADFFSVFVKGLIQREATIKWVDRSGDKNIGTPLLRVDEHCELLTYVALGMWESRVDYLKRDYLEFVTEDFCESTLKSAIQSQQIRERIRGHAMLIASSNAAGAVEFDHDEFRWYFLGEGIANKVGDLGNRAKAEVLGILRKGLLPDQAQQALIRALTRNNSLNRLELIRFFLEVSGVESHSSYAQINGSSLVICLLNGIDASSINISNLAFNADALRDKKLSGATFNGCYFAETSMESAELIDCTFSHCRFSQIRAFDSSIFSDSVFDDCTVDALELKDKNIETWDPYEIQVSLQKLGIKLPELEQQSFTFDKAEEAESKIQDLRKLVRYFMRSTHISESVILIKLSLHGHEFISEAIPQLLKHEVFIEVEHRGGKSQRRFMLGVSLHRLNEALAACSGSFSKLLELLDR